MINKKLVLSPAEILYILKSNCKIENLVKYTFLSLLSRRYILIELRGTTKNKFDYFIWLNEDSFKPNLFDHEKILLDIFDKKSKSYLSLIEYVTQLSNFVNEKSRAVNKKYKFEKYIEKSLLRKGIIRKRNRFISLFPRYNLSKEGEQIKNDLKSEFKESITTDNLHLFIFSKLESETIKLNNLKKYDEIFDDLFKKVLLNREWVVIPMAEFGREYPIPENLNSPK